MREMCFSLPNLMKSFFENYTKLMFQSFSLGSLVVTVGDFVLILNHNENNPSLNECDVVRVDQLYHDYENKTDPHRAVVTWFCRPAFLPPALRVAGHGLEEQGAPPLDPEHEVVGEVRVYDTDIEAESIYYKCKVVQGGLGEVPEKVSKAKKEGKFPCYLHRLDMKLLKKTGKKLYSLEPLFGRGCTPARRVLGEAKNLQQAASPGLRNATVADLASGSPRQSRRSVGRVLDEVRGSPSPTGELSSFVTNTAVGSFDSPRGGEKGLDGGYWGGLLEGKRTPVGRVKEKLVETETATNSGRKVKIKFGTEMETTTGSGRKVTLKGPKKPLTLVKTPEKKHTAVVKKSSGLTPDKITSLLDSDAEMEEERKPAKAKLITRKRRASVSCTTPPKLNTPVKAKRKASSRPASEVKPKANRRRSSYAKAKSEEESADSDDDDFVPKPKSRKAPPKVVAKKVESSEEPSEESEEESGNDSEEDEPSPKKRRKVVNKPTKKEGLTKAGAKQPLKRKSFQPKMAPRPKPLSKAVNSMTEAQQRLHVSAVPESLPCREDEFAEVGILCRPQYLLKVSL